MASAARPSDGPRLRGISEADAVARLRSYIVSYDPYDVPRDCLNIRSLGYEGVGYTLEVTNVCAPQSFPLGRWRVDAVTREVSHQRQSREGQQYPQQ